MQIYIVRHGETEANEKGYLQGWSNSSLNNNGINLAVLTGRGLRGVRFDYCISSPLDRAVQTAKIILHESGNTVDIRLDDRLKEINFGNKERVDIRSDVAARFLTAPDILYRFPNGESISQVIERTQTFIKELICKDDDKTYLISTHGCAMRAMLNYLYDDSTDFWQGHVPYNCSVTVVRTQNSKACIERSDKILYAVDQIVDRYKR